MLLTLSYSSETRDGSNFSCLTPTQSSKIFSHRSLNNQALSPEHQRV